MIIGIDGNEANVVKRVGIGEYAYELLQQFSKFQISQPRVDQPLAENLKFQIYLKNQPNKFLPPESKKWQYRVLGPKKLWTQFGLPLHLLTRFPRPDVFFTPSHYAPRFSPVPTVIAIMDVSYLRFPELFKKSDLYQLRNWTKYSVKKAKKIITISKSSKNDIIEEYKVSGARVEVIYPGVKPLATLTPHVYPMNELSSKYSISEDFVLYVGTLQPRKNIGRLIEAFSLLIKDETIKKNLQLVIVGKKGWLYEEILEAPKKFGVEDRVEFLDFVPDDELKEMYRHAKCFVLPSLYEGFGLPVLEAMQYDCPVITSDVSSLPEAGGEAALYVDPEDVNDISAKIKKVISNEKLQKETIEKGRKQVAKFSWEDSARKTLAILVEVGQKKE